MIWGNYNQFTVVPSEYMDIVINIQRINSCSCWWAWIFVGLHWNVCHWTLPLGIVTSRCRGPLFALGRQGKWSTPPRVTEYLPSRSTVPGCRVEWPESLCHQSSRKTRWWRNDEHRPQTYWNGEQGWHKHFLSYHRLAMWIPDDVHRIWGRVAIIIREVVLWTCFEQDLGRWAVNWATCLPRAVKKVSPLEMIIWEWSSQSRFRWCGVAAFGKLGEVPMRAESEQWDWFTIRFIGSFHMSGLCRIRYSRPCANSVEGETHPSWCWWPSQNLLALM